MISKIAILTEAYKFSAIKHTKQRRKGKLDIPYINHPIEVANILSHAEPDEDTILLAAAVLHDTIEDTDTSYEELIGVFGSEIADLVMEVTDDMSLSSKKRKEIQFEKARGLSIKAKKIRIADKICNVLDIIQTRYHWTTRQKLEYITWASNVVDKCRGTNEILEKEFDKALMLASSLIGWTKEQD